MQFLGNREEMTQGHPWSISQLLRKACAAPVSFPTPLPKPSLGDTDSGSTARAPGSPAALPGHQGHQQHSQCTRATSRWESHQQEARETCFCSSRVKQLGAKSKYPPERLFHNCWTTGPQGGVQQIPQFPAETRHCLISIQHGHQTKARG